MSLIIHLFSMAALLTIVRSGPFWRDLSIASEQGRGITTSLRDTEFQPKRPIHINKDDARVWKGWLRKSLHGKIVARNEVAMKIAGDFISQSRLRSELDMYKTIGAYENPDIVDYGIVSIPFGGKVAHSYDAIAMTLLEESFLERKTWQKGRFEDYDLLVMFQKLIRTLKYIHGHNVIHNAINPLNLHFLNAELFLIDFGHATVTIGDEMQRVIDSNHVFGPWKCHTGGETFEKDDMLSLVYTISKQRAELPWETLNPYESDKSIDAIISLKKNTTLMKEHIKNKVKGPVAEMLSLVYADAAIVVDRIPRYDHLYQKINDAIVGIQRKIKEPYLFSWLKGKHIPRTPKVISIGSIKGPSAVDDEPNTDKKGKSVHRRRLN